MTHPTPNLRRRAMGKVWGMADGFFSEREDDKS